MSYATQSLLANDVDFVARCNASAAQEIAPSNTVSPLSYVAMHIWTLAATPGFDAAYESAIASGIGRPGWDPAVITDSMILSAMQALIQTVPPEV